MASDSSIQVLAPVGQDSGMLVQALVKGGLAASSVSSFESLLQLARAGEAGVLMMTTEALSGPKLQTLSAALEGQPHWSDLPVIILVPGGGESPITRHMETELHSLPNATLLERPVRPATLVSAARAALQSRSRQYEVKRVIEERDRAAATLIQSEKLAAVGRLAASISHEINNPLESLTNLLYLVQQDNQLTPDTRKYLQLADEELLRASHITQQSLRFHRQSTRPRALSAEELLAPVLAIYNGRFANCGVSVECQFRDDAKVYCYEGEIRQVLSNLIGNAIDAMRTGGRLIVRAGRTLHWKSSRPGLAITIADNGHGMPPDVANRIFEAFYTTKGASGTGLGLWISSEIIRKHDGSLSLRSCTRLERAGTAFRHFLPLTLPDQITTT